MSVRLRKELEKKIAQRAIKDAIKAGFSLTVYDGEEEVLKKSINAPLILQHMFTTDEDMLIFYRDDKKIGWAMFIYGNDGYDVLSDYTTNLHDVLKGANKLADKYAA